MEKQVDVLVFAGTIDARRIIKELSDKQIKVMATVVSKFGNELLRESKCSNKLYETNNVLESTNLCVENDVVDSTDQVEIGSMDVNVGRLDCEQIVELITNCKAKCVLDASHPFANVVSENAIKACKRTGIIYIRFERQKTEFDGAKIIRVNDFEEAADVLKDMEGNIFLSTGSNHIKEFTGKIQNFKQQLYIRVLPEASVLMKCEEEGLSAKNIIAMMGPFSEEMNIAQLKHCNAKALVTKDSGAAGGVNEKISAAAKLGIDVVLINRPNVNYENVVRTIDDAVESCIKTVKSL